MKFSWTRRRAADVVLPDDLRCERDSRDHRLVANDGNGHIAPRQLVRIQVKIGLRRIEAQPINAIRARLARRLGDRVIRTCHALLLFAGPAGTGPVRACTGMRVGTRCLELQLVQRRQVRHPRRADFEHEQDLIRADRIVTGAEYLSPTKIELVRIQTLVAANVAGIRRRIWNEVRIGDARTGLLIRAVGILTAEILRFARRVLAGCDTAVRRHERRKRTSRARRVTDTEIKSVVERARRSIGIDHIVAGGIQGGAVVDDRDRRTPFTGRTDSGGRSRTAGPQRKHIRDAHRSAGQTADRAEDGIHQPQGRRQCIRRQQAIQIRIMAPRQGRPECCKHQIFGIHLQRCVRPVGDLTLERPAKRGRRKADAHQMDIFGILDHQLDRIQRHGVAGGVGWILPRELADDRQIRASRQEADRIIRIDAEVVTLTPCAAGHRREEARVRQARVIVHVVEAELGSVVELFGVVLQRYTILPGRIGFVVLQAFDRGRSVGHARQRVVQRECEPFGILGRAAEVHIGIVDCIVDANNVRQRIHRSGGRRFQRLPFELIERFEGRVIERLERERDHVQRREDLLDLVANAVVVVGVDRIGLIQRIQCLQQGLAPVDQLTPDLETELLLVPQRDRTKEIRIKQLYFGTNLAQQFAALAVTVDRRALAVLGDAQRRIRGHKVSLVGRVELVRMIFSEIGVDPVVVVQPLGEKAEVAVGQREILGDLGQSRRQIALVIVPVAIVVVRTELPRRHGQRRRWMALIAEQALAGLVQAAADVRIDVRLAQIVRVPVLHANCSAHHDRTVEYALDCFIVAPGQTEADRRCSACVHNTEQSNDRSKCNRSVAFCHRSHSLPRHGLRPARMPVASATCGALQSAPHVTTLSADYGGNSFLCNRGPPNNPPEIKSLRHHPRTIRKLQQARERARPGGIRADVGYTPAADGPSPGRRYPARRRARR